MRATSLPAEITSGTLDAELAALLWLLVAAGVPIHVTGEPGSGRRRLRSAILALATDGAADDADGPSDGSAGGAARGRSAEGPAGVHSAGSLEELLQQLGGMSGTAVPDEVRQLGLVLVLGRTADGQRRVLAAHYLRPVERDREGHLQRRPPALLSAWDDATHRFEDFAWGVATELAARASMSMAAFQREQDERAAFLAGLAAAGIHEPAEVERALRGFRLLGGAGRHEGH